MHKHTKINNSKKQQNNPNNTTCAHTCMCMYACIYIYIYICVYIYIYMYVYIYIYTERAILKACFCEYNTNTALLHEHGKDTLPDYS